MDNGGAFESGVDLALTQQGFLIVLGRSIRFIPFQDQKHVLLKYTRDGFLDWRNVFGNENGLVFSTGVDADAAGNIYLAGGTATGGSANQCGVMKLDPGGSFLWNRQIPLQGLGIGAACYEVAVDTGAQVYVAGELRPAVPGNIDAFVATLTSSGAFQWIQSVNTAIETVATEVKVGRDGNVVISGFSDVERASNIFMAAKFDAAGRNLFTRRYQTGLSPTEGGDSPGPGLALDFHDHLLMGGSWQAPGAGAGFLYVGASPEGEEIVKKLNVMNISSVRGSGSDRQGNFYRLAIISGKHHVIKLDPSGTLAWIYSLAPNSGFGLAVDHEDSVYVAGFTPGFRTWVAKFRQASQPRIKLSVTLNPASVPPGEQVEATIEALDVATNQPKAGMDVTLTAQAEANSGGHDHGGERPVGTFSGANIFFSSPAHGVTDSLGTIRATYTASAFGGLETVKANLTQTPSISASAALEVRVPDFNLLPDSIFYEKVGGTPFHSGPPLSSDHNHWGAPDVIKTLSSIASGYLEEFSNEAIIKYNDISLPLGGLFDINGDWRRPHGLHRGGRSIDARTSPPHSDGIPIELLRNFRKIVSENFSGTAVDIHAPGTANQHLHIEFP